MESIEKNANQRGREDDEINGKVAIDAIDTHR